VLEVYYTHVSFPAVPDAPEAPKVTEIFKDKSTVAWQPPSKDGGSPITGYTVERMSDISSRWISVTKTPIATTTVEDKELAEGTVYQYRVTAHNKAGPSKPSKPSEPAKAKDPWGNTDNTNMINIYLPARFQQLSTMSIKNL